MIWSYNLDQLDCLPQITSFLKIGTAYLHVCISSAQCSSYDGGAGGMSVLVVKLHGYFTVYYLGSVTLLPTKGV